MSNTTDQLGKQAKEVTEDFQEMGGAVRDAAQAKLGASGRKSRRILPTGTEQSSWHRLRSASNMSASVHCGPS